MHSAGVSSSKDAINEAHDSLDGLAVAGDQPLCLPQSAVKQAPLARPLNVWDLFSHWLGVLVGLVL